MNYIEIKIETTHQGVELVVAKLLALGITDTVIDDPEDIRQLMEEKESYHWDYVDDQVVADLDRLPTVSVYLDDNEDNRRLSELVQEQMMALGEEAKAGAAGGNESLEVGTLRVSVQHQNDDQWKDKWKEYFKPTLCGEKVVVKPTWEEYHGEEGQVVVEIDPGMAFGTGTHETTSLCIKALEKLGCQGKDVLDVGTGSGILSIVASKLGASKVLAVDIDPDAVRVAEENVQLNGQENVVVVKEGNLVDGLDFKGDIVVANLMADLVIMLSKAAKNHVKEGGYFLSSGILLEKEELVKEAIILAGFDVVEVLRDGMWCAIIAKN